MNCANHPAEAAVAQCTECGKGLCVQCVQNQPKPVCAACHEKLRSQTVGSIVFHLLVYVGLFILGYKLNFMEGISRREICQRLYADGRGLRLAVLELCRRLAIGAGRFDGLGDLLRA